MNDVVQQALNHYYDPYFKREAVKLLPGQFYATAGDLLLVTVLGSCVAACIRDTRLGIGGMNHFMLPIGPHGLRDPERFDVAEPARYGAYAMEVLINRLLSRGARRDDLEAKVFGGASVIDGFTQLNVGDDNARFVLKYLDAEGIRVGAQDLRGRLARKVYYFQKSGKVLVKYLRTLVNRTVEQRELEYYARLRERPPSGSVDLF